MSKQLKGYEAFIQRLKEEGVIRGQVTLLDRKKIGLNTQIFAEIKLQLEERGKVAQQTDVVTLNASLLEVVTDGPRHIASVHFNGMIREDANAPAAAFDEVWNLTKPVDGSSGWVVAGIQQLA